MLCGWPYGYLVVCVPGHQYVWSCAWPAGHSCVAVMEAVHLDGTSCGRVFGRLAAWFCFLPAELAAICLVGWRCVQRLYCLRAGHMTGCLAVCLADCSRGLVARRLAVRPSEWLCGCTARPQAGWPIICLTSCVPFWVFGWPSGLRVTFWLAGRMCDSTNSQLCGRLAV